MYVFINDVFPTADAPITISFAYILYGTYFYYYTTLSGLKLFIAYEDWWLKDYSPY